MPVNGKLFNSSHCVSDTFWGDCDFYSWVDLTVSTADSVYFRRNLDCNYNLNLQALGNLRFCDISFLLFPAQILCSSSFAELTSACFLVIMVHGVLSGSNCNSSLSNEVAEVTAHVPSWQFYFWDQWLLMGTVYSWG